MKKTKITRAVEFIDDDLIASAAENTDAVRPRNNRALLQRWAVAAAVFVIAIVGLYFASPAGDKAENSIVAIDVNPSLEIEVDPRGRVDDVNALNEDAIRVIGDMELDGTKLDVALNAIIGSMLVHGYISAEKNSILISVDAENSERAAELQASISAEISTYLDNKNIEASVITQSFERDEPSEGGISSAKRALVNKIVSAGLCHKNGTAYTVDQLAPLSVNELKQILELKNISVEGTTSHGSAGCGELIGTDAAKEAAFSASGVLTSGIYGLDIELDFEDDLGKMIYEVEFENDTYEFDYEIDARSGEIIHGEREPKGLSDNDTENDENITLPDGGLDKETVLEIAFAHAAVDPERVRDLECELEKSMGRVVYSLEFEAEGYSYEYEIDVISGEILRSDREIDD